MCELEVQIANSGLDNECTVVDDPNGEERLAVAALRSAKETLLGEPGDLYLAERA
jgi:hypothetical protein